MINSKCCQVILGSHANKMRHISVIRSDYMRAHSPFIGHIGHMDNVVHFAVWNAPPARFIVNKIQRIHGHSKICGYPIEQFSKFLVLPNQSTKYNLIVLSNRGANEMNLSSYVCEIICCIQHQTYQHIPYLLLQLTQDESQSDSSEVF
jgi:hypothetical protein